MINWVKEGFEYLVPDQEMVKHSFKFAALAHRIIFTPSSSVSIVNFEHVIAGWVYYYEIRNKSL